ncbi:HNH endonuclease signature motif containing protein [Halorubrum cibi]
MLDHVLPRSREGADAIENLRTLCSSCHQARHARFFAKTDASQGDGVI